MLVSKSKGRKALLTSPMRPLMWASLLGREVATLPQYLQAELQQGLRPSKLQQPECWDMEEGRCGAKPRGWRKASPLQEATRSLWRARACGTQQDRESC